MRPMIVMGAACTAWLCVLGGCDKSGKDEQQALKALLEQVKGDYRATVDSLDKRVSELEQSRVPLGGVVAWMPLAAGGTDGPGGEAILPPGFKICRKYDTDDPTTPFDERLVPDLTDRFVKGKGEKEDAGKPGGTNEFPKHAHTLGFDGEPLAVAVGSGRGAVWTTGKANFNPGKDGRTYTNRTSEAVAPSDDWRPSHVSLYYIIRVK